MFLSRSAAFRGMGMKKFYVALLELFNGVFLDFEYQKINYDPRITQFSCFKNSKPAKARQPL